MKGPGDASDSSKTEPYKGFAIGELVAGRFEIERVAGAGGMAKIYRARDQATGLPVALKELLVDDSDWIARFAREAELLRRVSHPNVVKHVAHGVDAKKRSYIAMEWLEGEDLGVRLGRGPLSVENSIQLLRRVAEGVAAIHNASVIHRDLKPENVFLSDYRLDSPKVIDLGIAFSIEGGRFVTGPGINVGTPGYMSPEHIRADVALTPAADVYSLGCLLFACITGRTPFIGEHFIATMLKALFEEAPRLSSLNPNVPFEVDALCGRLLSKSPELRPANASALVRELDQLAHSNWVVAPHLDPLLDTMPPALTSNERELISVVVAASRLGETSIRFAMAMGLESLPTQAAFSGPNAGQTARLHALAELYGARVEVLRDGSFAAIIKAARSPTDMAAMAARCAVGLRGVASGIHVALATGWDVIGGRQPIGRVVDNAVSMLEAQKNKPGVQNSAGELPILLDTMTAALLDRRFLVTRDQAQPVLFGEQFLDEAENAFRDDKTPFVGREAETKLLNDHFDECTSNSVARVAVVMADAGIGKSRLCRETLSLIQARRWPLTCWTADADPIASGAPLGQIRRLCRAAANLNESDGLDIQRQKLGAWVARHVALNKQHRVTEFLGELLGIPFRDIPSVELSAALHDPVLMGDQIKRAWVDLLEAECRASPVILVFEDAQWGDAATLECVDTALRLLHRRPLFVLVLGRREVSTVFPGLFAERACKEVVLGPLDADACTTLARAALGEDADEAVVSRIVDRAAGNAFCIAELVRAASEGRLRDMPVSVLAVMQARIATLDPMARRILRAASIFGQVFWASAIQTLLGLKSTDELSPHLEDLERDGLILKRSSSTFRDETEYALMHLPVREAAYAMLTEEDRTLGHRLAGEWLTHVGDTDAFVLATHHERGGASNLACELYEKAAQASLASGDLAAVLGLCDRSLACGASGSVLGAVRRLQAEVYVWRGEFAKGAACGAEAMAVVPKGTPSWYGAASAVAWAAAAIGDQARLRGVAEALLSRVGVDAPDTAQFVVFARVSAGLFRAGFGNDAGRLLDALAQAPAVYRNDPIVAANMEESSAWRAMYAGDRIASHGGFHASAKGFALAGDVRNQIRVGSNAAALGMMLGEFQEAASTLRTLLALSIRLGLTNMIANIEQNLGLALRYQGKLDEARALEERAITSFSAQGDKVLESAARIYLAGIWMRLGDLDAAEREAREALVLAGSTPAFRCFALAVLADVRGASGHTAEALGLAEQAIQLLDEIGNIEEGEATVRLVFAERLIAVGDVDRARVALQIASARLRADASRIDDPHRRATFLRGIDEHRRTLDLAAAYVVAEENDVSSVQGAPTIRG